MPESRTYYVTRTQRVKVTTGGGHRAALLVAEVAFRKDESASMNCGRSDPPREIDIHVDAADDYTGDQIAARRT